MRDRKITRTTKELEDLLMVNEKKQRSSMEELLAEMESAVARVEKREKGAGRENEADKVWKSEGERHVAWKTKTAGDSYLDEDIPEGYFDEDLERALSEGYSDEADEILLEGFPEENGSDFLDEFEEEERNRAGSLIERAQEECDSEQKRAEFLSEEYDGDSLTQQEHDSCSKKDESLEWTIQTEAPGGSFYQNIPHEKNQEKGPELISPKPVKKNAPVRSSRRPDGQTGDDTSGRRAFGSVFCAGYGSSDYFYSERDFSLWRRILFADRYVSPVCPVFL